MNRDDKHEAKRPSHHYREDAEPGYYNMSGQDAELWLNVTFARRWYEDAVAEARIGGDFQNCRREIVFAVCAAESYLFEWIRDDVLSRDFQALNTYFPPGSNMGVRERWKCVLKKLSDDGLIQKFPNFNREPWANFCKFVNYRNGLVHGGVSRPETEDLPSNEMPVPTQVERGEIDPGLATRVVCHMIKHIHAEIGTAPPSWLIEP